jgi:hypothetical protein
VRLPLVADRRQQSRESFRAMAGEIAHHAEREQRALVIELALVEREQAVEIERGLVQPVRVELAPPPAAPRHRDETAAGAERVQRAQHRRLRAQRHALA